MTIAHRFSANRSGRALAFQIATEPPPPPPPGERDIAKIFSVNLNQTTGTMSETVFGNHGTVSGAVERGVTGITSGSSTSCAGDGQSGRIVHPHILAWQEYSDGEPIYDFTVKGFIQPDSLAVDGSKYVFVSKAKSSESGRFSVEYYNDGGTGKIRAHIGGVWIGGSTGAAGMAVAVDTAARWTLTHKRHADHADSTDYAAGDRVTVDDAGTLRVYEESGDGGTSGTGAAPSGTGTGQTDGTCTWDYAGDGNGTGRLWLNDGASETDQTILDGGLTFNTADLELLCYNGGVANFDGVIDDTEMWDGALDQTAIEALDDASSITHGGGPSPPGSGDFACPALSGTNDTNHKDLGSTTTQQQLAGGTNVKYDFTGTELNNTYNSSNNTYSPSFNIRMFNAITGGCMFGGTIRGGYKSNGDSSNRQYPGNHAGQLYIRDASVRNFIVDSFRFDNNWDPIRFGNSTNLIENVTFLHCFLTNTFDDILENDTHRDGILVDRCLFDGFYSGISDRNSGSTNHGNKRLTISETMFRLRPTYSNQQHKQFFKLNANSISFDIFDSVFRVDQAADVSGGDPFYDVAPGHPAQNKIVNSSGNIIIWGGSGSYPYTVPSGFSVYGSTGAAGKSHWDDLKTAWLAANSQVPLISGIDT